VTFCGSSKRSLAARDLVVDASVAGAAGGLDAKHATAVRCRDFLAAMLAQTSHSLVLSFEIEREWDDHQSGFARAWRRSMDARRRVVRTVVLPHQQLRRGVENCPVSDAAKEAMVKDLLLIEAALASDDTVVSRDDAVRDLFRANLNRVRALSRIVWVNPDRDEEEPIVWLRAGARAERHRLLGYAPGGSA